MVMGELDRTSSVYHIPGHLELAGKKELTHYFIIDEPESPTLVYKDEGT